MVVGEAGETRDGTTEGCRCGSGEGEGLGVDEKWVKMKQDNRGIGDQQDVPNVHRPSVFRPSACRQRREYEKLQGMLRMSSTTNNP